MLSKGLIDYDRLHVRYKLVHTTGLSYSIKFIIYFILLHILNLELLHLMSLRMHIVCREVLKVLGVTLNQDTDLKSKDQFPGPKSKKMSFWSVVDN